MRLGMARANEGSHIFSFLYATHTFIHRKHSPDGAARARWHTPDYSLPLIYRPRKDERLTWA